MPEGNTLPVNKLKSGQKGKVVEITGGQTVSSRLSALGIIPGQTITKISSMLWRGPVTIQAGSTSVAIGYGMANKIIVEPQ